MLLQKLLQTVITAVRYGRRISTFFMSLPTDDEAPGYSAAISAPISISCIRDRLKREVYSLAQLDDDMRLMMANAHKYNDEESQVYWDATELYRAYGEARAKQIPSAPPLDPP